MDLRLLACSKIKPVLSHVFQLKSMFNDSAFPVLCFSYYYLIIILLGRHFNKQSGKVDNCGVHICKAVVCTVLSVMMYTNTSLAANQKE